MSVRRHCRKYEETVLRGTDPFEDVFGVQRLLDPTVASAFKNEAVRRQDAGEINERLKVEDRPRLVLLGKSMLVGQLYRGMSHQPAEVIRRRVDNSCLEFEGKPEADVIDFRLAHGQLLEMVIQSGQLTEQKQAIADAVGSCGLRSLAQRITDSPLVVTIGKVNKLIPQDDREEILDSARAIFDEIHYFEPVILGDTEFYPEQYAQAA